MSMTKRLLEFAEERGLRYRPMALNVAVKEEIGEPITEMDLWFVDLEMKLANDNRPPTLMEMMRATTSRNPNLVATGPLDYKWKMPLYGMQPKPPGPVTEGGLTYQPLFSSPYKRKRVHETVPETRRNPPKPRPKPRYVIDGLVCEALFNAGRYNSGEKRIYVVIDEPKNIC